MQVDLEEALEAPRVEVAGADEHVLAVAHERLGVQHRGVLDDAHAGVEQRLVMEPLGGRTRDVVRLRRHEEADLRTATGRGLDPPDHPLVADVRIDHVEGLARAVEEVRDGRCDRAIAARRVVQHGRRDGLRDVLVGGKQGVELLQRDRSAEPAEAGDEDELQLRDHRPGHPDEEVVEAAVGEVVLDPGATDPAGAAVDHDELSMVEVPQLRRRPQPRRAHDADLHATGQ